MLRTRQTNKEEEFGEISLAAEKQTYDTELFVGMYREATVPLTGMPGHNSHLNWYNHFRHYNVPDKPLDTAVVHIPSKLFWGLRTWQQM